MRMDTAEKRAAARAAMIPKGAVRDARSSEAGEAFTYESGDRVYAMAFRGSAGRPEFHYRYRKVEERNQAVDKFFESLAYSAEYKAARRAKRAEFRHSLAVGDVLSCSWGYDQTNIDYYEVTKLVGEKKVEIREIGGDYEETGFMCGQCVPAPGKYIGEPKVKLVQEGNSVRIASYACAYKMEPTTIAGAKVYSSSYCSSYA